MSERELRAVMKAYASAPPAGMFGNIMKEVKVRKKQRHTKPLAAAACAAALVGVYFGAPLLHQIMLEPKTEPNQTDIGTVFAGGEITLHVPPNNGVLTPLSGLNRLIAQPMNLPDGFTFGGSQVTISAATQVEVVYVPGGEVVRIHLHKPTGSNVTVVELVRAPGDRALSLLPRRDASYSEMQVNLEKWPSKLTLPAAVQPGDSLQRSVASDSEALGTLYVSDMSSKPSYLVWQRDGYSFLLTAGVMTPEEMIELGRNIH